MRIHTAYKSLLERGRLSPNPNQAALVDRLATLQSLLIDPSLSPSQQQQQHQNNRGIYIYGNVGTGKSRLADLFAATMPSTISTRRIHFHEFMMDIHMRLHLARQSTSTSPIYSDPLITIGRQVRAESQVLCFDEFQVTDIADAMILRRLFAKIWGDGGVMVATSNRHPRMLYENGLNRDLFLPFVGELERRCEVWKLLGDRDYRMMSVEGDVGREGENGATGRENVFFTEESGFEEAFQKATDGAKVETIQIPVMMNRLLEVDAAPASTTNTAKKNLIINTTFEHLCHLPRSAPDFSALCSKTSTIFIRNLRRFKASSNEDLDYIRRFITLVDLAYETRTRIICLSSVPLLDVFADIVPQQQQRRALQGEMKVKGEGGSSSSMMSTFIGETEWSATGLREASLATGGAGETDVRFAVGRAVSRLFEMGSRGYGIAD